ncbi:MAG: hypothetical protein GY774_14795 [Planctomycetes bacterium]|nr:hypothetical protein [Planctomycetota bacterium]
MNRYRLPAATEPARARRHHPEPIRDALLAIFCWQRRPEIIDGLIALLIQIIHRISVRAEKKVDAEMIGDLDKVDGNNRPLFRLAEAAIKQPEGRVKDKRIDKILEKDDFELGLDVLLGKHRL